MTEPSWDRIKRQWRQITGHLKSSWGQTEATHVAGKRQILIEKLQARYGVLKDDAEKQIDDVLAKVLPNDATHTQRDPKVEKRS